MDNHPNQDVYDSKTGEMIPYEEAAKDCFVFVRENKKGNLYFAYKEPIRGIIIEQS